MGTWGLQALTFNVIVLICVLAATFASVRSVVTLVIQKPLLMASQLSPPPSPDTQHDGSQLVESSFLTVHEDGQVQAVFVCLS